MSDGQLPIVVVGGSMPGIFAAHRLALAGKRVVLLERGAMLGGAAVRVIRSTGTGPSRVAREEGYGPDPACSWVAGWMVHLFEAFSSTETLAAFDWPTVHAGNRTPIRSGWRPAPFHLFSALLRDPSLDGSGAREALRRVLRALVRLGAGPRAAIREQTLAQWMQAIKAEAALPVISVHLRAFGAPSPPEMSASRAAAWLQCAWMTSRWASRVAVPAPGGPDLAAQLSEALANAGANVQLKTNVLHVAIQAGRVQSVVTDSGAFDCRSVILAIDPTEILPLLGEGVASRDRRFAQMRALDRGSCAGLRIALERVVEPGVQLFAVDEPWTHAVLHAADDSPGGWLDLYGHFRRVTDDPSEEDLLRAAARLMAAQGWSLDEEADAPLILRRQSQPLLAPGTVLPGVTAHPADGPDAIRGLLLAGSWCDVPSAGLAEGAFEAAFAAAAQLAADLSPPAPVPPGPIARRLRTEDRWPPWAG